MSIKDIIVICGSALGAAVVFFAVSRVIIAIKRKKKDLEKGLDLVPFLIHLPPSTDDVNTNGRDERDVANEVISQSQVMYSILSSCFDKGMEYNIYGQKHFSFEIVAKDGTVQYYVLMPKDKIGAIRQAIVSAYPTAMLEKCDRVNIFSKTAGINGVSGTELRLKKEYEYPISTYEDTKRDASVAILNAMSVTKEGEGLGVQILCRPAKPDWSQKSTSRTKKLRDGGSEKKTFSDGSWLADLPGALVKPPETHDSKTIEEKKPLTAVQQDEIAVIENKAKYPAFEVFIRVVGSSESRARSEAMVGGIVTAFSQFDSVNYNGFKFDAVTDTAKIAQDYVLRRFPSKENQNILNSVELASVFHLPEQNSIPTGQIERQSMKQVDGPAKLVKEGVLLGVNEFRGEQKEIRLSENDRRRHTYVIGATGMGKSVLLKNIAYQDIMAGRGFAFLDPHGDAVEDLLAMIPPERADDVIYFDPSDIENPIGMNMFEFETAEQRDLIVQEGINMLYSLYDPGHTGIFGPRGEHMFRNAALLLMSDPKGATFIDIPKVFVDPELVKSKLKYVTDRSVYDYWTKEFPQSQKSNDAGEVTTWFASKWGPFLSNTMMKNILGQTKSGFNIREIMDNKKIFLVNLSKGKMGEMNSKLLGMILVMKFQMAAMSRADMPEDERKDFCLFVDEFQNFSTESFESILSEARKYRLNLIVANQFLTQLTDKIREGILGNVGTIIAGRLGVTDAEMLQKAFAPTFVAEDLHKLPNRHAITTVMMFDMPTAPFTMRLVAPMGEKNVEVAESLKRYSGVKYGKTRKAVEDEINGRQSAEKVESKPVEAEKEVPEADVLKQPEVAVEQPESVVEQPEIVVEEPEKKVDDNFVGGWLKKQQDSPQKEGIIKIR